MQRDVAAQLLREVLQDLREGDSVGPLFVGLDIALESQQRKTNALWRLNGHGGHS